MIDFIVGTVTQVSEQEVVIDVGVIGIMLNVPTAQSIAIGQAIKVYSYMHWNQENGPSLYGFTTPLDRSVFKIIIGCSGIGPKIALALLADLGAQRFLHAVSAGEDEVLSKVNGIGKKKAEQVIVHLKHKVAALIETGVATGAITDISHVHDVTQALQSLNYSRVEISRAMDYLKKNITIKEATFDALLRQALSYLSKQF